MRKADIVAIRAILKSGQLGTPERAIAQRVLLRHRANIIVRTVLGAVLGQRVATEFIDRLRRRQATERTDR